MRDPDTMLTLLLAALVITYATVVVVRWPLAGLWMLAAASGLSTHGIPGPVTLGSVQLHALDAVAVVLTLATIHKLLNSHRLNRSVWILTALMAAAVIRGASTYSVETAFNAGRLLAYVIIATAFTAAVLGPNAWELIQQLWRWWAIVLMVVAGVYVVRNGLGTYGTYRLGSGDRALTGAEALIVGQAAAMTAVKARADRDRLFVLAALAVVLISQQRTAWAATAATMLVVAVRTPTTRQNRRAVKRVRALLIAAVVASAGLLVVNPGGFRESVSFATDSVSVESGTLGWRIDGWSQLLDEFSGSGSMTILFGQPAGVGFVRVLRDVDIAVSPHNMYLTVLISLGVIGLAAMVILVRTALRRARRISPVLVAILCGLAAFSIGYQVYPEAGVLAGAAFASRVPAIRTEGIGEVDQAVTGIRPARYPLSR